jgi:uncharacterized protein YukJ
MALSSYGVLKAAPADTRRGDDHFQIRALALGEDWRVPVKVAVALGEPDAAMPLFQSQDRIPGDLAAGLAALAPGFHRLHARPGGLALDYVRGGLIRVSKFRRVVPDRPGAHNDLKDYLAALIARAINEGAWLYAFGEPWGPEEDRADQVFGFAPGRGVHDIHMNQGSFGKWRRDNGVYQDGALFLAFPDGDWRLLFLAFQTQSFKTDAHGDPV